MRFFLKLSILFILGTNQSIGQIIKPNVAMKSHPTMVVEKVETILKTTVISISIKNEIAKGASFCADKNIVLIDPVSKVEYKLLKTENIAVCPEQHLFKRKGEVLHFKLYFPELPTSCKYIDLVEQCKNDCFYVNGIVIAQGMNAAIEMAYWYYSKSRLAASANAFNQLTLTYADYPYAIYYFQAIKIYSEMKDIENLKTINQRFQVFQAKDKTYFLNAIGRKRLEE